MSTDCCSCAFVDTPFLTNACGAGFTLLMGLIQLMVTSQCDVADPCNRAGRDDFRLDDAALHDFIVVGAGAAGSVIAARLAEQPGNTVLLLEAGPEEPSATLLPAFAVSAIGSSLNWGYTTVPQDNACLSSGGVCRWPRGKMVSGTVGMQGMMYTRGHASIYDAWAAGGADGWAFKDVLPYFKRAENNQEAETQLDEGYHGFEGPLVVNNFPHHPSLADAVVQAGVQLGYRQGDLNGANQTGFAVAPMMVSDGLRGSTARLYLRPAAQTGRLNVSINSHVTRVLFDATGRATGVEYVDKDGANKTARAGKEVILSAGAVGSPQLLLLSGVGPRQQLAELGIPLVADLPVGQNLHNHVSTAVTFTIDDESRETLTLEALDEFLRNRTGPMSGTGLTQTTGFMRSKFAEDDVPDLQVFFDGFSASCSRTGLEEECTDGSVGGACGRRVINARPTVILPRSMGTLTLNTANPFDQPLLDPNYLEDPRDADVLVDGIRQVIALTETPALQAWGFQLITSPSSGCEGEEFGSTAYWACHVRAHTGAENHQGGSCRMGGADDAAAVLDPRLRVRGVTGLRVVDASVFPYMPNSNPIAAIVMAAEKCADLVQEDWQ